MQDFEPTVNPTAEAAVVTLLSNLFNGVAYMDPETVRDNIELASGGMSENDRFIRADLAEFFMDHFATIFGGLVINKDFRKVVVEAVDVEIALDEKEDDALTSMVHSNQNDSSANESREVYEINFSVYDDEAYKAVNRRLFESFEKTTFMDDEVLDDFCADLSDDDMMDIGYCVSNFMYLIRAFAQNQNFSTYIKKVVESVERQMQDKE